jgi:TPR repeat protein
MRLLVATLCFALALTGSATSQSLDEARAALASGRSAEASRLAEPLAAAGQTEALAILGIIARDAIPPETERARALLETSAASGSLTALVAMGRAHQLGQLGLTPDPSAALQAYEQAVAAGSAVAEVNLIGLIASGALGDPDWPALRSRLAVLAEEHVPGAAVALAEMLATGRGGVLEPSRARALAADAGAQGNAGAMRLLGWMQIQGVGGPVDREAGLALLRRAAGLGHGAAATDLGLLEPAAADAWFERAALAGDGWGATHLARRLSDIDPSRAVALFEAGDARGIPAATHGLALAYWDGTGAAVDLVMARRLMVRAAAAGFPRALNDLGVMWETGAGGDPDPVRAAEHYEAAARAGDPLGAWNLADLLLRTDVAPNDPARGYAWCLWAEDNASNPATRAGFRDRCARATAALSADERARGAALFLQLPPTTPAPAAP